MDLSQLEIFLSIAEEKSFSRAAEKMLRTQPAISIAIKRLEEELGEILFDRSSKNGSMTEAGKILFSYAQRMPSVCAVPMPSLPARWITCKRGSRAANSSLRRPA